MIMRGASGDEDSKPALVKWKRRKDEEEEEEEGEEGEEDNESRRRRQRIEEKKIQSHCKIL